MNEITRDILENRDVKRICKLIELARKNEYSVCVWGCGKIGTTFGKDILDFLGIKVDYYCDSNKELENREISSGVYCRNEVELLSHINDTICFLLIGYADVESACQYLVDKGVRQIVTYDDLCELKIVQDNFLLRNSKDKIAIYTCITNGYDYARKHEYVSDNCDYYIISDNEKDSECGYNWINVVENVPKEITDPIYVNRFCKMHPHLFFENYRYSIYVDGNITITGPIDETVDSLRRSRMATAAGNYTDNYYSYAMRCAQMGADYQDTIYKQVMRYRREGLPSDVGSYLCNILIREHNNPMQKRIMEDWWNEFCNGARRDQISLPYVLWKNGFEKQDVLQISDEFGYGHYAYNPLWKYERAHKKERYIISKE